MIIFKKIKWRNFLSTGNTPIEIELNKAPTTLIVGTNGSGKSNLIESLLFIFGKKANKVKLKYFNEWRLYNLIMIDAIETTAPIDT